MRKLIIPLSLIILFACGNGDNTDSSENRQYRVEGDYVIVPGDSPILQNVKIERVNISEYRATFAVSGTIRAIPSGYAEIAAPFSGRIVKSFVRLGQKVSAGSPIFEINSPTFFEAGKAYYQAKQEMELAQKNLNRERDLFANGVGVAKDMEEAEVNYELCKKEYENMYAAVKVYLIDPDEMTLGQPLIIRSPIAGEVVKSDIVIGQYIAEDAGPLAVVADLSKVWMVANVKEKDIHMVRGIEAVDIDLVALPGSSVSGNIYHIGGMLNEETHSVEVIIECDNRDFLVKPHMYGTVRFTIAPVMAVLIPNSAVLQDEETRYVLVSEGENRFRRANVNIASADNTRTVILSGLSADDSIVTEGAFYFIEAR